MPNPVDPSNLEGDELDRWYRRSPLDIERERQAAADERYRVFFAPQSQANEPVDTSSSSSPDSDDVFWVANGSGGYRAIRPNTPDYVTALGPPPATHSDLPSNPAAPEAAMVVDVGNPHNPRLRREWIAANGRPWPKTADGRNFDVAHRRAIADGGTNTLDNIEPMHPDDHRALHISNGDAARWARRASIARAFGGRVEPPTPSPRVAGPAMPRLRVNGLGLLSLLPDLLGMLNGRIRTDSPIHALSDMGGFPAPDDPPPGYDPKAIDPDCRSIGRSKPGEICT